MINQFVASITHKPLETKLDQARVKAFISALRDCLSITEKKPIDRMDKIEPVISEEEHKNLMEYSKKEIKDIRKNLRSEQ